MITEWYIAHRNKRNRLKAEGNQAVRLEMNHGWIRGTWESFTFCLLTGILYLMSTINNDPWFIKFSINRIHVTMDYNRSVNSNKLETLCNNCGKSILSENVYFHNEKALCEDCCLCIRTPLSRKTHWQYLKSIKNEYLIPGKQKKPFASCWCFPIGSCFDKRLRRSPFPFRFMNYKIHKRQTVFCNDEFLAMVKKFNQI